MRYGAALALAAAGAAVRLTVLPAPGTRAAYVTFFPAVMFAALYGGLRPGLLAIANGEVFWSEQIYRQLGEQPDQCTTVPRPLRN